MAGKNRQRVEIHERYGPFVSQRVDDEIVAECADVLPKVLLARDPDVQSAYQEFKARVPAREPLDWADGVNQELYCIGTFLRDRWPEHGYWRWLTHPMLYAFGAKFLAEGGDSAIPELPAAAIPPGYQWAGGKGRAPKGRGRRASGTHTFDTGRYVFWFYRVRLKEPPDEVKTIVDELRLGVEKSDNHGYVIERINLVQACLDAVANLNADDLPIGTPIDGEFMKRLI